MSKLYFFLLLLSACFLTGCPTTPINDNDPIDGGGNPSEIVDLRIYIASERPNDSEDKVMNATIQDKLGEHLKFVVSPEYADAIIYLGLSVDSSEDLSRHELIWTAKIHSRGVRKQTGQEYWNFQLASGDIYDGRLIKSTPSHGLRGEQARNKAVRNVANAVAHKIIKMIHTRPTISKRDEFLVQFAGFRGEEKNKIETMILGLDSRKQLELLPGGGGYGNKFEYKIKWLGGESQGEVERFLQEEAGTHQLSLSLSASSPGIITFTTDDYSYSSDDE